MEEEGRKREGKREAKYEDNAGSVEGDFPPLSTIEIGEGKIRKCIVGAGSPIFIAGPCVIEGEDFTLRCADTLLKIAEKHGIQLVFKSSYDKANRTSIKSFRGPGVEKGLEVLRKVREKAGIPVLSDVHCRNEIKMAAEVLDVIQVPAFLARQTDMLIEAGRTGKPLNIKKPQFVSPYDTRYIVEKVLTTGNRKIMLCERGTMFGYRELVVDFRSLPIMRKWAYVIFDGTHSTQRPSAYDGISGGDRWMTPYLSRAAAAIGVDGFFFEVHPEPDKALSDPKTSITFEMFSEIVEYILRINEALR